MDTNRPSVIAVILLCCGALTTIAIADESSVPSGESISADIQRRVEDGARTYSHFATGDIVCNRPTSPHRWPPALYQEQARLLVDLRAWAEHAEAMRALISHADAKVRTLALGVLFVHEDPQDLPLIASLVDDKTPTIPDVHDSPSSQGGVRSLGEIENPQTVGDVAQSMLVFYLQAAHLERGSPFANYWLPRQGRKTCASWFLARFRRATRQTTPLQPEYYEDVKRVLSEINALPTVERAWTQVYLLCDGRWTLEALLKMANADLTEPLVSIREISDAWPPRRRPDQDATQARWRDILRRHYAN